jgi:type II secretory pathway component GspD/PulD (secretin)
MGANLPKGGNIAVRTKMIWCAVLVLFTAFMLANLSFAAWTSSPQQPTPAAPAIHKLMLNYEDEDLHEFIIQIASALDLTPIVIDPDVKGKVTLRMSSPMPKEDVLKLFHTILKSNKAALVKQDEAYKVVAIADPVK